MIRTPRAAQIGLVTGLVLALLLAATCPSVAPGTKFDASPLSLARGNAFPQQGNLTAIITLVMDGSCVSMTATAYFYGNATGGYPPYAYTWAFGDGSRPEAGQNVTHAYAHLTFYNVTLWVTDARGGNATAEIPLEAMPLVCTGIPPLPPGSPTTALIALLAATAAGFAGLSLLIYSRTRVTAGTPRLVTP